MLPRADGYHTPGAAFRYSSTGYCLLALIVAQVAGQPFAAFLRERIFAPLGMASTVAHEAGGLGRLAPGLRLFAPRGDLGTDGPEPDERDAGRRRDL